MLNLEFGFSVSVQMPTKFFICAKDSEALVSAFDEVDVRIKSIRRVNADFFIFKSLKITQLLLE
ncbi:hypothetical protein NBRC116587_38070 [Pseudoteredinibacter isoporae]